MAPPQALTTGSEFPPLEEGKLRLYSNRVCPYAQRTRIMLAHKNIEYETVNIHLISKPDWYLNDINPLGLVPTLQMNDKIVYDSKICNDYLDEVYPGDKLVPSDPYLRARDKMLMEHYTKVTGPYYKGLRNGNWDELHVAADFKSGLDKFEKELDKRDTPFFGGEKPMNIDFCIWPHLERVEALKKVTSELDISQEDFPRIRKWMELISAVPAVRETMFSPEMHLKFFHNAKSGIIDFDLDLKE